MNVLDIKQFYLTHKCVRFGAYYRQMTRKMNLHCDTLDAQNELIHSHILLSPMTLIKTWRYALRKAEIGRHALRKGV